MAPDQTNMNNDNNRNEILLWKTIENAWEDENETICPRIGANFLKFILAEVEIKIAVLIRSKINWRKKISNSKKREERNKLYQTNLTNRYLRSNIKKK